MIRGRLLRESSSAPLVAHCLRTTTALERMRGLLGRPRPGPGEGLLIDPCRSIHTFGMRYAIDVVYLDASWQVRKLVPALPPGRLSSGAGATRTLELGGGEIARLGLVPGERLRWVEAGR